MSEFTTFWGECFRRAKSGSTAFANDWQWVFGIPVASGIGTYLVAQSWATTTTGNAIVDSFIAALVAFILTWFAAIVIRAVIAAAKLWGEQKDRADKAELRRASQEQLNELAKLRRSLLKLKAKMSKKDAGLTPREEWAERFRALEKEIYEKIATFISPSAASLYIHRGNIERRTGPRHQKFIDLCTRDVDHLEKLIREYSH